MPDATEGKLSLNVKSKQIQIFHKNGQKEFLSYMLVPVPSAQTAVKGTRK